MIYKRINLMKWAFLVVAMCVVIQPSESVELERGSEQPPNAVAEGITSSNDHLTINVDDVEIAQLLRMLSVKRRVSIVAGPGVSGRISVNLYDVTFEEALNLILDVSGCTATYKGDAILVTEASEKADLPLGATDMKIQVFRLDFADADEAFNLVEESVSRAGRVVVSAVESTLLVEDTAPYLDRISSLLEQIDVPPRQVLIEATLLELSYTNDLTVGVQVDGVKINGETIFRALTNGFAADFRAIPQGAQGLFAGVLTDDTATFIEALAETVDVKMLANPKILAVDKQEAEIIIGDRLGFRITTTTETSSLESVEFLDVGVQLTVTPRISDDGLVLLEIHPEVSSGNISAAGLPSESTAEATTYMLVRDGETVVLGGLLKETTSERVVKVPLLGDIPWLGHLFRRTQKSTSRSELVVLITPHIVGPEPTEAMKEIVRSVEQLSRADRHDEDKGSSMRSSERAGVAPFRPARSAHTKIPSKPKPEPAVAEPEKIASSPVDAPMEELDKPVVAAIEKPSSAAPKTNECSIQVFASRSERITGDYVRKLQQAGFPAWVKSPDRPTGDKWYRAMIGRFSTRAEAEDALKNLKQRKKIADAFVRLAGPETHERDGQTMFAKAEQEHRRQ